jgi:hypothetical protein
MSPKSKHKSKKYIAQPRAQSPSPVQSGVSETTPKPTPTMATATATRSTGAKAAAAVAPITTSLNIGREMRTIGIIAGILLVALIVLSIILS